MRAHEFVQAAKAAGFVVKEARALATADPAYVESIRPHLLPRYRNLSNEELGIIQYLLVLVRPAQASRAAA